MKLFLREKSFLQLFHIEQINFSKIKFSLFQDIISFAKSKQIPIDNAKRDSLYIGLKKLRQKIRRLDNQDSFEDKKSNNFEEVQSRYD